MAVTKGKLTMNIGAKCEYTKIFRVTAGELSTDCALPSINSAFPAESLKMLRPECTGIGEPRTNEKGEVFYDAYAVTYRFEEAS